MKRYLVGALVGAILLFGWQAVSHMFMHHHDAGYKAAPNSQAILAAMSGIKKGGQYMLPDVDLNATHEQQEAKMKENDGKPWAIVTYHPVAKFDMPMNMIRSFCTALLSVLILIGIMGKNAGSFSSVFVKTMSAGFLMFLFIWYNQNIWMQTPWDVIKGELIDLLAGWGLVGLWLGWWLNRRSVRA